MLFRSSNGSYCLFSYANSCKSRVFTNFCDQYFDISRHHRCSLGLLSDSASTRILPDPSVLCGLATGTSEGANLSAPRHLRRLPAHRVLHSLKRCCSIFPAPHLCVVSTLPLPTPTPDPPSTARLPSPYYHRHLIILYLRVLATLFLHRRACLAYHLRSPTLC
jgi:hypothetical protein